jgi:HK97 family phage major capsid protein
MDFGSAEVREKSKEFSKWCKTGEAISGRLGVSNREWQFRAMGVGEATKGAKAVPDAFYAGLVAGLSKTNPLRRYATRIETETGNPLSVPVYDDSAVEAVVLPENAQSAAADVAITSVVLGAHKLHSKTLKASSELLEDGGPAIQRHLGDILGRRLSHLASQLFTTGSGVGEPTGILTAASVGVTTTAPTAITYDELVDLRYCLDAAYDESSQWMMAPATLKVILKITDDASRPVFRNGLLFDRTVVLNDSMPALEAEAKPILFGDLRSYGVREVTDMTVRRYEETYAQSGQIGLAAIQRVDGNLLDANGVAVLQMAGA